MRFALTRLGYSIIVIFLVSVVTFAALHASPGSVISSVLNVTTTPHSVVVAYERSHGLLDPLPVQYWRFISGVLSGNLGTSLVSNLPVLTIVKNSIGYTVLLAGTAFLLTFGLGIPLGVLAAVTEGSWFDRVIRTVASFVLAIPNFVLAIAVVLILAVHLRVLPAGGAGSFSDLIMPAVVLAAEPWSLTVRVMRTSFLEHMSADFTRTLRARGVPEWRVQWLHVLRNAAGPVISVGILQIRNLLAYTLLIEVIFDWPGLGTQLVNSVLQRDYNVTLVLTLLLATVIVLGAALGDILLSLVDPRVRVNGGNP
jgi:peptide/nickel transport system permease protein